LNGIDTVTLAEISNINPTCFENFVSIQYSYKLLITLKPVSLVFNLMNIIAYQTEILSKCVFYDVLISPISVIIPWENVFNIKLEVGRILNSSNGTICSQNMSIFEPICKIKDLCSCNLTALENILRVYISENVSKNK
jgi:hypothetical protein